MNVSCELKVYEIFSHYREVQMRKVQRFYININKVKGCIYNINRY